MKDTKNTKWISFRLPLELFNSLEEKSKKLNVKRSDLIRQAIIKIK
jgi:metal-responsive CopG/Arc/MetJ family transcriptional regulator